MRVLVGTDVGQCPVGTGSIFSQLREFSLLIVQILEYGWDLEAKSTFFDIKRYTPPVNIFVGGDYGLYELLNRQEML